MRPDYQNPGGAQAHQSPLALPTAADGADRALPHRSSAKAAWPATLPERVKLVTAALAEAKDQITVAELAKRFARAKPADIAEIMETLCALGRARRGPTEGTYLP